MKTCTTRATFSAGGLRRLAASGLLLFAASIGQALAQAPSNDDPCGAVALTAQGALCTLPTLGTTVGASTTAPSGYTNPAAGCGTASQPQDVWFTFTTAASGPASFGAAITVTGNPAGTVRLFSAPACQGPFTQVACTGSGQANTVAPRLTTGALQANTTYYVSVSGYAPADPAGAFTICLTDGPGQPTCAAPTLGQPTYGSSGTATIPYTLGINNTTPVSVLVTNTSGFSQTTSSSASPIQLSGLAPSGTYTVTLTAPCGASGQTAPAATTTITLPGRYCDTNLGGACSNNYIRQVSVQAGPNASQFFTTAQGPFCNSVFNGTSFSAYTYFPPATGSTTATIRGGQSFQLSVLTESPSMVGAWIDYNQNSVFEASEYTLVSTHTFGSGLATTVTINVPASAQPGPVGLRLRSAAPPLQPGSEPIIPTGACGNLGISTTGETEDYTLTLDTPVTCPIPTNVTLTNITATAATLNFTPVSGAQNYTVVYLPNGGASQTFTASASPFTLTSLLPNTAAQVQLTANCSPGNSSGVVTLTLQTPPPAPANDECAGALPLPVTGSCASGGISGSTLGATPSRGGTLTCSGLTLNANDVWYSFTATASTMSITLRPSFSFASGLYQAAAELFSGSCTALTSLNCTATAAPVAQPVLTLPAGNLTVGQTYYVRVMMDGTAGFPAGTGFTLCATTGGNYSSSGMGGSCTDAITNVTIVNSALNSTSTCATTADGSAYTLFPATGNTTASLSTNSTQQIRAITLNGNQRISGWLDLNQNLLFEPSEWFAITSSSTAGQPSTATFPVPATASLGLTGLRIRSRGGSNANGPADAYTTFSSGETEDYMVTITLGTAVRSAADLQLKLYPNPAQRSTNVELPAGWQQRGGQLQLFNALGQAVRTQTITASANSAPIVVALTGLPAGLYVLRATLPGHTPLARQLVIE